MRERSWSFREAKRHLGKVVDAARLGLPQQVTKAGRPAVTVIATAELRRLQTAAKERPLTLGQYLLTMPRDDGEFDCCDLELRDVEF